MSRFFKPALKLALILSLGLFLLQCSKAPVEIRRVKFQMGTKVEILVLGKDRAALEKAAADGFGEIERLEQKLSRFREDSMLSRINEAAGAHPVQVDSELFMLIQKSVEVCDESSGAFDITILPVLSLWKFNGQNSRPPSPEEVKDKLALVGCKKIILKKDESMVFLPDPGMAIDLGGIAKGYAADKVAELLQKEGVSAGIVNIGGDMKVFGGRGGGMAVGVQDPRHTGRVIAKIYLKDSAIATSGDYERFFIYRGIRYSHIIDPGTGYPVRGEESVSVIAKDGLTTDAWATALFVLGSEQGLKILESRPGLEALFIDQSGRRVQSRGLEQRLIWLKGED